MKSSLLSLRNVMVVAAKLICSAFRAKYGVVHSTYKIVFNVNNLYAKSVMSMIFAVL